MERLAVLLEQLVELLAVLLEQLLVQVERPLTLEQQLAFLVMCWQCNYGLMRSCRTVHKPGRPLYVLRLNHR